MNQGRNNARDLDHGLPQTQTKMEMYSFILLTVACMGKVYYKTYKLSQKAIL